MKRVFCFVRRKAGALLCVLLSAALITGCLCAEGITVSASGEERSFDLGVNPESVTAVLGENGVLTVSGSGAIRDFTPETAPFAKYRVTTIKLGADLTAIGSYTFYNCESLTGALILPKGLLRIGDKAFSGDSAALAPRPEYVENPFTEALVTRKKEAEPSAPESTPEEKQPVSSAPEEQEAVSSAQEPESALESASESVSEPEGTSEKAGTTSQGSGEEENRYVIEHITQQEIGTEIFYPRENGPVFFCSAENESFRAAMTVAGFREAQAMLPVTLHYGKGSSADGQAVLKNIPVADGRLTLPGVPPEFSAPEGDGLYQYVFSGWTETQDEPNTVRSAGSAFSVGERTDLYLIANWSRELVGKIAVAQEGDAWVFTAPEPAGYEVLSYRWQTCVQEAGQPLPADQEKLSWKDIPGEVSGTYRHQPEPADSGRWFRCIETVQKKQNLFQALFSTDSGEEVAFSAVQGVSPAAEGDTPEGDSAGIVSGKNFSGGISGGSAVIPPKGTVTAGFQRSYTPSEQTESSLWLCAKGEGTAVSRIAFPAGTKLLLGDMSSAESSRYYSFSAGGGAAKLPLSDFTALDGGEGYSAPAGTSPVSEKLIVVVDFSGTAGAALPQGEYFLAMTRESSQQPESAARASFTVAAEESCSLALTREEAGAGIWKLTVTSGVPGSNVRYTRGACIRLALTTPDGQQVGFPTGMVASGEVENIVAERDGTLTFTMAQNGSAAISLNLSAVQESELAAGEYRIKASLSPRAGLQMAGSQGTVDAQAETGVSLSREEASAGQRSVNVELGGDAQRLVDASEAEVDLAFNLSYRGIQPGDTLQAQVLCKTGKGPESGSYSPVAGDWSISPASGSIPTGQGETLHLVVPKGQERGTYRLLIRIADSSGSIVAEQPYNFIVK